MTADIASLIAALQSTEAAQRQTAAEQLAGLGSDAQPAAVALVEACETADDPSREWIASALEDLGPPRASDLVKLAALLRRPARDVAYWAATLIGRLEAEGGAAVPELIEALGTHPQLAVRQRSAWALGQLGPLSAAARAALHAAAASSDPRLASLARKGLENGAQ